VDLEVWTPERTKLIKRAASYPQVHRIFVHPAIKKVLCEQAGAKNRGWLAKVRPWWNHYYHFHVRLSCPPGIAGCANQNPVAGNDGCGTEIKNWYAMLRKSEIWKAKQPPAPAKPAKSKKRLKRVADLPKDCKTVLASGGHDPSATDPATVPVALRAVASKDAGPPPPRLDAAALQALIGGKPSGMPLPDRKPTR
jgi:penicillin-insensitive murein endopeptidase